MLGLHRAALIILLVRCPRVSAGPTAPEISATNEGVRRHGTLQIYGEGFEPGRTKVFQWQPRAGRDSAANMADIGRAAPLPSAPQSVGETRTVISATRQVLAVACEVGIPQRAQCFVVWVANSTGASAPFLVNRPKLWWLDKPSAAPGERVCLFGRNLMGGDAVTVALRHSDTGEVLVAKTGDDVPWAIGPEAHIASEYRTGFGVPTDARAGRFEVFLHNGSGLRWGWSNAIELEVRPREEQAWAVVAAPRFGAKGDGVSDDARAIERAIAEARTKAGAWVHFPAGLFCVTHTVVVPPQVGLRGVGKSNTILRPHPSLSFDALPSEFRKHTYRRDGPDAWARGARTNARPLVLAGSHTRFSRLALECGDKTQTTVMTADASGVLRGLRAHHVRFGPPAMHWHGQYDANATKRGGMSGIVFPLPSHDIEVRHCEFTGGSVRGWKPPNTRWHISHCTFDGVPNNHYAPLPFGRGTSYSIVEHNRCLYPSRGWVAHGGAKHNFIFNNAIVQTRGDGGGEPYLFEGTTSRVVGRADAGDRTGLVCRTTNWGANELVGMVVLVVKGRGLGQYRFVKDNTADRIEVAEPWRVEPDATTVFSVANYFVENLLLCNSDTRCNISHYYGNCIGNVWAAHRSFEALGFAMAGFYRKGAAAFGPCYFNDLVDCSFQQMRGMVVLRGNGLAPNPYDVPLVVGNRIARTDVKDVPIVLWDRWEPLKGRLPWARWQTSTNLSWRLTIAKGRGGDTPRPKVGPSVQHNLIEDCAVRTRRDGPQLVVTEGCADNVIVSRQPFRVDGRTNANVIRPAIAVTPE